MRTLLCTLLISIPLLAGAGEPPLTVQPDTTRYLHLARGSRHGLHDADQATTGALCDQQGDEIGIFAVVRADELDSLAAITRIDPGHEITEVVAIRIEALGIDRLPVTLADPAAYLVLTPATGQPAGLPKLGAKGDLYTADGRFAGQLRVVATGKDRSIARITSIEAGVFAHQVSAARIRSYLEQVVGSSGLANLSAGNLVMLLVGLLFIYLGVAKEYEPLLLVPIGFGILLGNIPLPLQLFDAISVYMIDPVTHEYTFNTTGNSVLGLIYFGVRSGLLPPLIFLGIGALTDFTALLSSPRSVLLGAAAQVGIFATFLGALWLGFSPANAASIGIIGGADGPTAIFISSRLAPSLIGPIAIAAYSYMAMVPIIQPPIMRLLTTRKERLIRMKPGRTVTRTEKIIFPIAAMLLTCLVAPGGLPLLGMLFLGNLLKESGVTGRLAKTASSALLDIATILLGIGVGASTTAQVFLNRQSVSIFALGCCAFAVATAGGVLFAKLLNLVSRVKLNPLIGAAGVSAVPDSARVVHHVGQEEDPENYLLQHAMGPNVAGVIGSAIAAGVFLGIF